MKLAWEANLAAFGHSGGGRHDRGGAAALGAFCFHHEEREGHEVWLELVFVTFVVISFFLALAGMTGGGGKAARGQPAPVTPADAVAGAT